MITLYGLIHRLKPNKLSNVTDFRVFFIIVTMDFLCQNRRDKVLLVARGCVEVTRMVTLHELIHRRTAHHMKEQSFPKNGYTVIRI